MLSDDVHLGLNKIKSTSVEVQMYFPVFVKSLSVKLRCIGDYS